MKRFRVRGVIRHEIDDEIDALTPAEAREIVLNEALGERFVELEVTEVE